MLGSLLEATRLRPLMERTIGDPQLMIGLIDGPVQVSHPDLVHARIRALTSESTCHEARSPSCRHGTFVVGILSARRGSAAPAICPGCTVLSRAIFAESKGLGDAPPLAESGDLAAAITDCVNAGARILNISAATDSPTTRMSELQRALDNAARKGVIVVAAAGNGASLLSTVVTRHPWVISVVGCDLHGRPLHASNLGKNIGSRGLSAPGDSIPSLDSLGGSRVMSGTSAAAPFVTSAVALIWSLLPRAKPSLLRYAIAGPRGARPSLVPPLLQARPAFDWLQTSLGVQVA